MRRVVAVVGTAWSLSLLTGHPAAAQVVSGQSFEVTPEVTRATVGDSITLRFRVRLDERDLLFDTVPQPISPPSGVRLLSVEKLQRTPDRIFHGQARVAFYRTGRMAVPRFGLPFMRAVKGVGRATLTSDSASVEIVPLLPAGNPPLKDIRELEPSPRPSLLPVIAGALAAAALLAGGYLLRRNRRPSPAPSLEPAPLVPVIPPSALEAALERLARIDHERWPAQGQVARHYEGVVDVLRGYLEAAEDLPARERTTEEVLWSLPPHLSEDGMRGRADALLGQADLVKFARLRPTPSAAAEFLLQCRSLLEDWHAARSGGEVADALR
jgi:hypothetical protein